MFLSPERAGVTAGKLGLPLPGDGTESNGQKNILNTFQSCKMSRRSGEEPQNNLFFNA